MSLAVLLARDNKIRFIARVGDDVLLDLYRSAAVFVMPRMGEGLALPSSRHAATGLAAIGGGLDGSVDVFAHGAVGRLIDPPSNDAIGAVILDGPRAPPASRT